MNRVVFQVYSGSTVYGTQTPLSDIDTVSAYVPDSHEKLFCLTSNWNEGSQKLEGEVDDRTYDLRYFIKLVLAGQTGLLESLFVRPEHIVLMDPIFRPIYENRNLVLISQMNVVGPALGYAEMEYKAAIGKTTGPLGKKRKADLAALGYSPKNAHHCLRIMAQSLYCVETGAYSPYPPEHEAIVRSHGIDTAGFTWIEFLRHVKFGNAPREQFLDLYGALHALLKSYHVQSGPRMKQGPLPGHKNREAVAAIHKIVGEIFADTIRSMK